MCKKTVLWVLGAVLCLAAIPPVSLSQVVNLAALNNSFEEDDDFFNGDWGGGWVTWNPVEGNGSTIEYDATEFIDGSRSLRVNATGTVAWHFEVIYAAVPLEVGKEYTASVWAKAKEARSFTMQFKAMDNSTTWGSTPFDLTTEWAEYAITSEAQNNNIKLEIHCGGTEIPMWLDFFYIYEGPYVAGILPSGLSVQVLAHGPNPLPGSTDALRDVDLSWTPGEFAQTHDVYFGTVWDDVNAASAEKALGVLVSRGQSTSTFDPGQLEFGQTYYWRIDEVNGAPDYAIFKGEVWNFTVESFAYRVPSVTVTSDGISEEGAGPENTINGSGLNASDQHSTAATDMWLATPPSDEALWLQYDLGKVYKLHEMLVWNYNVQFEAVLGFGLKDVTVEYSENGTDWSSLGDVEFAKATSKATYTANTAVDFGGVPVRYVRLTVNSGWGMMGQFGLSEVRFMYVPAQARKPQPADGVAGIDPATTLSWRSGREAAFHEVYLGMDPSALPLAATVAQASYTPGDLEFGSTYYWQIVEVNEADAVPAWAGDVWNFSTLEYALVEGFETYDDDIDAGTAIFDTWIDGWVNDTGSTVGYFDAPFAEKTIVHSGAQSMPLQYDNTASPFYSETEREFETAQNWTGNGADTLVLYVRGNAPDFAEAADGSIVMSAIGTDIWGTADQFRYAYKNLNGDGSMTVRVDSIVRSNEWAKAGVMIRETLEAGSKHAFAAATPEPTHGLSFQRRPVAGQDSANTDVADIELPHWVKLTRTGNIFTVQQSEDGVTWIDVAATPAVDIQMAANVYIGLAVTSHDAAILTAAEFSNLSMTGNVSGGWQTAEIGVAQPMGNSSEPMYVTIEDSTGKTKTVVNADAAITTRPTWQEWAIPYSDLSGLNLSRVKKMYIGVGSRTNPAAGGTGIVYIDDIAYGSSADE
jgi:regulation of enolase protein 1 (concanavalin A-like superfamily)